MKKKELEKCLNVWADIRYSFKSKVLHRTSIIPKSDCEIKVIDFKLTEISKYRLEAKKRNLPQLGT